MNIIKLCVTSATAIRKNINEAVNDMSIETISLTDWFCNSYELVSLILLKVRGRLFR